ncbi:hypothetical protein V8C86DRAFT_3090544, partial [Haematococcus lacustris]
MQSNPSRVEPARAARPQASFWQQVSAVLLKDAALQGLVDSELSGRDYRCGCQCLSCCEWVTPAGVLAPPNLTKTASGREGLVYRCRDATPAAPCSTVAECKAYNDSACGVQYSSYQQAAFCALPRPPTWPAMIQFPLNVNRPARSPAPGTLAAGSGADDTTPEFNNTG